ncbi:NADPH-dependent FMN reductase [Pseudochryseolinea flava]|uniref:Flavoprotein n=1 Tax=Pseudochryseolinea flava TaxID=2059302 RepID=A0A364Y237_9BACT|nr:NAD(P)H-dependent oxidoreductase [Pseudochryseolinea flava]RAW00935.1 flavoprotein [Pseudochryseolinea flava]
MSKQKHLKIVAIPGSLRSTSSSYKLLEIFSTLLPGDVDFQIYNRVGYLPHFDDNDNDYKEVDDFRVLLRGADAIVICTPEYAFGVPGSLKNALDWTVSSGEFVQKPVALITASSQGEHCHAAMKLILTAINARLSDDAMLLVPFIRSKFDRDGQLKELSLKDDLQKVIDALLRITHD